MAPAIQTVDNRFTFARQNIDSRSKLPWFSVVGRRFSVLMGVNGGGGSGGGGGGGEAGGKEIRL